MRYEHYNRVVKGDRRARYPERGHEVPGLEGRTRMWVMKGNGYELNGVAAACSGRRRRTGKVPERVVTKKSVASRRLKEGDAVGAKVGRRGKEAYGRREERRVLGRVEIRPFNGLGNQGNGVVDKNGKVTFHREQPGVRRRRMPHYEEYYKYVNAAKGGKRTGRYRSVETGAKTREVGRSRLEGRRRPRIKKEM